jgi:hypothetical protein
VVQEYDLAGDALALLTLGCEAMDRCDDARAAIDKHGATFTDRFGQLKMRPEVLIERDSRQAVARILKQLNLDLEPLQAGPGRPAGK